MSEEKLYEYKRTWLPIYLVLLVALALVSIHFLIMYFATRNGSYANLALLAALGAYLFFTGFQRLNRIKITRSRVIETVRCESCDYLEERGYEAGDYVFGEKGVCPRCGGKLTITAIYSVREEE